MIVCIVINFCFCFVLFASVDRFVNCIVMKVRVMSSASEENWLCALIGM